ncbi:cysteine hydrolase [Bradyrhizobium sp. U87765 SZCCT0131]|uniref:isochorismatase family protein n=1 Tax=unclassified Bradyrhizobium TaxID=2631580 RepID=UPI001BAE40CF|nr:MULTISPECIES: cysteine hydrolase [unclassified Bradyrhizobium]MBR1222915.1 cysteine hydrolase [Bradyrhizobium sp. U87765 SZCCT0131]MBR1262651.1 cysteine hydrolase [Bradyrhizobium sp. U87765 SZCCT0134]MBR1308877.1 cysteine hydrolase [Bradyrhizobium sp. U87765 SZCCT0110]MBR1318433.1 cysteine hydrolase [Bradyrhizobium sp. U87765 SZCCT0109]MBR1352137.1 cysteine hydrolase [Bradyrhizobium sp. U87765 SZCCT0048]
MHTIQIPQAIIDRLITRRGRRHVFERIEPAKTALVVVDMQAGFLQPGAVGEVPLARAIVPNVRRLAAETRAAGGAVVWLRHTTGPEGDWSLWLGTFMPPAVRDTMRAAFTPGHPAHAVDSAFDVQPGDLVVDKTRYSAFVGDASDLDAQLRARGIDTLIVTGTLTNVCCESTARDAMMLNYAVHFVADGTATRTDEEHNASLTNLMVTFADVRTTDEVVALLRAG